MAGNTVAAEKACSKCHERPRAVADSTNPWCKECLAEYAVKHRQDLESQAVSRGVGIMRQQMQAYFRGMGRSHFSGAEVAAMVAKMPAQIP